MNTTALNQRLENFWGGYQDARLPNIMSQVQDLAEAIAVPHELCNRCTLFWKSATCLRFTVAQHLARDPNAPEMPQQLQLSSNFFDIERNAASGCHFCCIVLSVCFGCANREHEIEPAQSNGLIYGSFQILNRAENSFLLSFFARQQPEIFTHDQLLNQCQLRIIHHADIKRPISYAVDDANGNQSRFTTSTFSDATAALIQDWIRQCDTTHLSCQIWSMMDANSMNRARPRRLLDVRASSQSNQIRVIDNDAAAERSYCALSYSWGRGRKFLMTSKNLPSLRQGINVNDLPKTIRDAIEVTRRIGVPYLWIDALCIMQDSTTPEDFQDWISEAPNMKAIFGGSFLTIAASESFHGDEGFIQPRSPLGQTILDLWHTLDDLPFSVFPPCTPHCAIHAFSNAQYHLDTRSWVLQERLLAPRTVHFTKNFAHFECKSGLTCESVGDPPELDSNCHHRGAHIKDMFDNFSFLGPGELPPFMVDPFLGAWHNILQKYSGTNLSKSTDLLIALAGLSAQLRGNFQLTPTFGLWKEYLLRGMLWYVRLGDGVLTGRGGIAATPNRAPSWSWVCLDMTEPRKVSKETPLNQTVPLPRGPRIFVEACFTVELVATVLRMPETFEYTQLLTTLDAAGATVAAAVDESRYAVKLSAPFRSGVPSRSSFSSSLDLETKFSFSASAAHHSTLATRAATRTHPNCLSMLHPECPFHPDHDFPVDDHRQLYSVLIGRGHDQAEIGKSTSTFTSTNTTTTVTELGLVLTPVRGYRRRYRRVGYFHHSLIHRLDGPDHVALPSFFEKGGKSRVVEVEIV